MSVEDKEREFYFNTIQLLLQQNRELIQLLVDQATKIPAIPPSMSFSSGDISKMMGAMFTPQSETRFSPSVEDKD